MLFEDPADPGLEILLKELLLFMFAFWNNFGWNDVRLETRGASIILSIFDSNTLFSRWLS